MVNLIFTWEMNQTSIKNGCLGFQVGIIYIAGIQKPTDFLMDGNGDFQPVFM